MALAFWAALMAIKNALSKFCKRHGKAQTTGFISLIVMVAALIPEHRIRVSLDAATRFLWVRLYVAQGGNVTDGIDPNQQGNVWATITDGSGHVLCSFRLALNDRILLSNINSEVSVRKIAKDEHLWTRKSLVEVIKEMSSKNWLITASYIILVVLAWTTSHLTVMRHRRTWWRSFT